jgi:RNA polymerase sigma-70 factor, ECF subfamily
MDSQAGRQMQNRNNSDRTDDFLVEQCKRGDQSAFNELMRRYHAAALKVALSIVRDRQDAEDEVQNAFWKAFKHIAQFNKDAKFSTWLTRIVVNQCLMKLRRARRTRYTYIDDVSVGEEIVSLDLKDARQTPEQALGRAEVAGVLYEEIRRTPPLLRSVFLLRDVEQRPMPEVAELLGISVAAAKSRLLRARAELRHRMQRHHGEIGPATLFV